MVALPDPTTTLVLLAVLPLEYLTLMRWLARRLTSAESLGRMGAAVTPIIAPLVEERLREALPAIREGLKGELAGLLADLPKLLEESAPKLVPALGKLLDGWAASPEGQEALGGLLTGAVARVTPAIEAYLSSPAGAKALDALAVKLRQDLLRWWGSQKGGAARKALKALPAGTTITGIPIVDEKIAAFVGGALERMLGGVMGADTGGVLDLVPQGQLPAAPADGLTLAERSILYGVP